MMGVLPMFILFIIGLILGSVTVIFALQNVTVITVTFFAWQLQGSLALILIMTLLVGMLAAILIVLPEIISKFFTVRKLKKDVAHLEDELKKQKEQTIFAKKTPATPEELSQIEKGAIAE
jgi:uncharacterized integral membrane protein